MASGAHLLAQQKANVEARIRSLVNNDLKEICKTYGAQVSGTKAVLQSRCLHGEFTHLWRIWWRREEFRQ